MSISEGLDNRMKAWERDLAETRADMAEQEKLMAEPFAKQAELDSKRARYNEVMAILNPKEEQSLEDLDEDTEQEQSRSYLDGFADNTILDLDLPGENYGLVLREYSLPEVFSMFYRGGSLGVEFDILFDNAYAFCKDAGITFEVVATVTNKSGESVPGVCTGNHVRLSQEWFNDKNFSNKRKSMVILHEILHAGTMYAVNTYLQIRKGDKTVSMPKDIYDSCARILRVFESIKNNPDFEGQYGKAKMTEMIAELSNPTFVSLLKMSYPSLWHKLIDTICEMLGINRRFNNYALLKKAVEEILSHPDYRLAGEYYEKARLNSTNFYLDESQYYDANEQYQQRTNTLTDREVLSMASESGNGGSKPPPYDHVPHR